MGRERIVNWEVINSSHLSNGDLVQMLISFVFVELPFLPVSYNNLNIY